MAEEQHDKAKAGRFPWTAAVCGLVLLMLIAAIVLPNFVRPRATRAKSVCWLNLLLIDQAKGQWARYTAKTNGYRPTEQDVLGVLSFLKNSALPVCPQGGAYTLEPIGKPPHCSVGGPEHSL
jgi:hypothetical protein